MKRILIVEDERSLARGLQFNLNAEGFDTRLATTGEEGLAAIRAGTPFDALLVDVMLPGIDGFELVRELRSQGCFVPVMILTARKSPRDVVEGLSAGADDYVAKPFDLAVLLARVRGLLRRHRWSAAEQIHGVPEVYEFNGRRVDFEKRQLDVEGKVRDLTVTEARLLYYLIANEGRSVSRDSLLRDVWGLREDTDTRAVDNFIVRLRRSLEPEPSKPRHVLTVRGVGYRFVAKPEPKLSHRLTGAAAKRFRRP